MCPANISSHGLALVFERLLSADIVEIQRTLCWTAVACINKIVGHGLEMCCANQIA